jgi:hypothetical protein
MGAETRTRARFTRWSSLGIAALLIVLQLPGLVMSQELVRDNSNKIKAAFLRNFAHYVVWPTNVFADDKAPWHVCVLGRNSFGDVLEKTLQQRAERERSFEIYRADTLDSLPQCQIMYVGYDDSGKRRSVLSALKGQPVLTVGDAPEFLLEGGIIRFQVGERVEMSVNLDRARSASLTIPTKMLEVSYQVLDGGVMRTLR